MMASSAFLCMLFVLLLRFGPAMSCSPPKNSSSGCIEAATLTTLNNTRLHTGEDPDVKEPRYRPLEYTIVGTASMGSIFVIGVLGNVMVVLVVLQTRSMHTPTNCYLVSLSLADLMVLISSVPNEMMAQFILEDEWVWGRAGCKLFIFTQYLGINASALSITAFTVERYIAICLPMKAQTVCTVNRAKKIILCVWLFALCYCAPWLFFLTTTTPIHYRGFENFYKETCTFSLARSFYIHFFFADFILFYVVPLIMSCVFYGLMARVLFKPDIASATKICGDLKTNMNGNSSSRVQVVKMLIVVVVLFATLWLPYRVLLVYNSFAEKPYLELWYLMLCKTLIYINSAVNPILYNAMSIKFRRAFRRTLSCGKHTSKGLYSPSSRCAKHKGKHSYTQKNHLNHCSRRSSTSKPDISYKPPTVRFDTTTTVMNPESASRKSSKYRLKTRRDTRQML
ncbi:thyrotropin-releasing hormone receptor-like [Galendromus occidentalis]|uniref:Thyrotropin-releasing hormone receptor n=1 Tax=Galendromus occidentalis TaxID=34638 RepID=A0AAJ6QQN0_9ACAR|nr:thyrotropin-releasing hormone receptor-like [Galendromus occidentalis]